ncbi:winged helix-turn-helix transcriptional regulator [Arthrobacter echini]|uniref:Winged helix-turn-helix transcriptional regulator n=1 Tax=Arthrobacter echini TaxID=1529066 RepID=A0A4V3Z635_9MICC|nr:metalloregulator ArsR/SmtB family transcription factor [Arthrobacter echini]THJ68399.1 winged helix-turn-helix transcriptional regulator [Arthrobacter echini]
MGFDDVFAVIAERTRRQILESLQAGDKAVGELVVELQVSQPTVSKHLKVLREAGLVTMRAQGQKRYYSLDRAPLGRVGNWLTSLGATGADDADASEPVAVSMEAPESAPVSTEPTTAGTADAGAGEQPLAPAVVAVADLPLDQDVARPQPGWTATGMGRAAGRAADLLSHLRRRRDPSA